MLDAATALTATLARAPAPGRAGGDQLIARAQETAKEFEAVFLTETFKEMFSSLGAEDPFNGTGQEIFREMLSSEYASSVAEAGGIGLADEIFREILQLQEVSQG
jgi:Rod binding domain-containing protein